MLSNKEFIFTEEPREVKPVMIYDIIGVDEQRAKEIQERVESLMFYTSYDITEIPIKIVDEFTNNKEAFLAGMVFADIVNVINSNVYKG